MNSVLTGCKTNNGLTLFYTNAGSLLNKLDELKISISLYNPDIICICETHFSQEIDECEVALDGYRLFRADRGFKTKGKTELLTGRGDGECSDISKGGGSVIYVKDYINPKLCSSFNAHDSLVVSIQCDIGAIHLACVYRSQALTGAQNKHLINSLKKLSVEHPDDEIIIVGDLNLPDVCWVTGTVRGSSETRSRVLQLQKDYVDLITDLGLTWHITDEITRRRVVSGFLQESTLDQVITSNDAMVNSFEMLAPLGKSDHRSILCNLSLNVNNKEVFVKSKKILWGKIDSVGIENIAKEKQINWDYSPTEVVSSDTLWYELKSKLGIITDNVPSCNIDSAKGRRVPWENSTLKRFRREKDKHWTIFDEIPSAANLSLALAKQGKFEEVEVTAKIKYERKITANLKTNNKAFFGYLRRKRKLNVTVNSLKKDDGTTTVGAEEAASELASFFGSVFEEEPYGPLEKDCFKRVENFSEIGPLTISVEDVQSELLALNVDKSPGPDGVHPKLLRSLAADPSFVSAVHSLFVKCATDRKIPADWKIANVVALHKKGSRDQAANHRPVSLTCVLGKVYQKFVRKHILQHVEGSVSRDQHGFIGGRSCTSNLLEALDTIIDMMDEGLPVDVLYFDFRKAFDTVPHYRLLVKLENMGITGETLEIVGDFLSDRAMRVGVGDSFSELIRIISGVPQGSVLGPILFLLFINDLPDHIKSRILLFADDLKLIANAVNKGIIDEDLKSLERWEDMWCLRFNLDKCKVLHISANDNPSNKYYLDSTELVSTESEKDLGFTMDVKFDFGEHIKASLAKANKMIAWVSRNVICKDKVVMSVIYRCLVRPHLEYCVQCWCPTPRFGNWELILSIEKIQRKFTRLVNDIGTLSYGDRLKSLHLTTLAERRMRGDLIETFKILRGLVNYGQNLFRVSRSGLNLVSRGNKVSRSRQDFLSERVINYWNNLPNQVKLSTSVDSFKCSLEAYKSANIDNRFQPSTNCFWEVSEHVLSRIETPAALAGRSALVDYWSENPWVAKKKGINLFVSSKN